MPALIALSNSLQHKGSSSVTTSENFDSSACGDVGLGLTVLDEQLSHGPDSANVGGHAIPAILCGNQCAVLYDTMPTNNGFLHGGWIVIIFD